MYFLYRKSFLLFAIASLTLYIGAIANDCEDQYNDIIFLTDVCAPLEGSDQCPASCQESLDTLDMTCSVDGATIYDEPYEASTNLAAALIFVSSPCNSTVADELLAQVDDTCQGWGTLYLATTIFFCSDDTVCSPFCQGVQDGFYRSCAVDDEVMTEDSTTGEMNSMPVYLVQLSGGIFLGEACKEYGEGKKFKESSTDGLAPSLSPPSPPSLSPPSPPSLSPPSSPPSPTSSSSALSISIFPVILSLVVSSTHFPSWLA